MHWTATHQQCKLPITEECEGQDCHWKGQDSAVVGMISIHQFRMPLYCAENTGKPQVFSFLGSIMIMTQIILGSFNAGET